MRSNVVFTFSVAAIVLAIAWAGVGPAPAMAQDPGLQFSLAVPGLADCNTKSGDASCDVALGSAFVVDVNLDELPADVPRYTGVDIQIAYSGVTLEGDPDNNAWPDCAFAALGPPRPGSILFGCATGLPPGGPSNYLGTVGTISFSCGQSGTVTLVHGDGNTDVADEGGTTHFEGNAPERLTIDCVQGAAAPTAPTRPAQHGTPAPQPNTRDTAEAIFTQPVPVGSTATLRTATPPTSITGTPTSVPSSGSGGGGIGGVGIAIIAILAAVGAGSIGFLGWRFYQGRRGTGGGT